MLEQIYQSFFFRILLAGFLGALIGIERDIHSRAAGFRTHMFVSMGAALFTIVSFELGGRTEHTCDAARIAAQIVSGIGFLGAGAILHKGDTIKGLTTAVCIWVASAIGMAVAIGMYSLSFACTALVLIVLIVFKKIEMHFRHKYHVNFVFKTETPEKLQEIHAFVQRLPKIELSDFSFRVEQKQYSARMELSLFSRKKRAELVLALSELLRPVSDKMISYSISLNQDA